LFNAISSLFTTSSDASNDYPGDAWYCSAITDCADGIWDWNLETQDLYISPKLRDLTGYTPDDIKNRPIQWWFDQIHPEDQPDILRRTQELPQIKGEYIFFDGCRFLCKNGDYIWLEHHAKIKTNEQNKLLRITAMVINITPQKYIQNQLYTIISDQEKEARNKMKFLSSLSHEFRSPLSGILGMTTLLKETPLTDDQHHCADNISNSTEMLLALVNDILDVSKLSSGKFEFEKIRFSPLQTLKRSSDLIRPSIVKKNLRFHTHISQDVPEYIMGDPTRLQQILVNLLTNAAKFTTSGSIHVKAEIIETSTMNPPFPQTITRQRVLYFEITDTGIGIAPDVQANLFEDYTQANRSITRMYGGTGLGLSICKELVHLMGGQIGVKSMLGQGSTFWFTIPFEETSELPTLAIENSVPQIFSEATHQTKLNILLVEDNQVNQEVMRGLLNHLGDDVTVANNGEEAISLFQTQIFDLVLMDLNMPILDGLGATQSIRKLPNGHIPIIAVTANTFSGELENYEKHGITHVLNKPIDKATLERTLSPYRNPASERQPQEIKPLAHSSMVDEKALQSLIHDLGKVKVITLVDLYRRDAVALVGQIKSSHPDERKGLAHTLAGMSENLGIIQVGKIAREIMTSGQNDSDGMPLLIQHLEEHLDESFAQMQRIIEL
jgi:PAS domain S-box-containing protein